MRRNAIVQGRVSDAPAAEYRRCAYKHALRITGNKQDAEEIANDVILNFLRTNTTPAPGLSPYMLMKRPVIDALRARSGKKGSEHYAQYKARLHAESIDDFVGTLPDPGHEGHSLRQDLLARIKTLNLSPMQHAVAVLQGVWGFTDIELAEIFGVTPMTISNTKSAASPVKSAAKREAISSRREVKVKELKEAQERIRHLEILLEAKGIVYP